jgi:hypothetical protein
MPRFIVQHHAVLASTMDAVRAGVRDGAPDGTVVVAGRQTRAAGGKDVTGSVRRAICTRPSCCGRVCRRRG